MQEYFGNIRNLARIKLMTYVIHALCIVQTVNLHKLAAAMPTTVERDSTMRRLQRFFAKYALNLDLIARMIFSLLPVRKEMVLSMDRTNWKSGEPNINILMLGITYKEIAFLLLFRLLDKRGTPIGWNARLLYRGLSTFSVRDVSIVSWQTGNLSARNGLHGLTKTEYGTTYGSGRTFGS
ncbi:hypothetical protein H8784_07130 [Parabacteroides acidifaciens]|nr:hypothetical protein [Parabacteroides acidifaciens]